jgi:small Trp-rich protein
MGFLIVGVLLLAMKLTDFGPAAQWSWLWILLPFGLAVAWWTFADVSGLTKRREMRKMDERKAERRQRSLEQLGLGTRRDPRALNRGSAVSPPAMPPPRPEPAAPRAPDESERRDPRL